MSMSTVAFIYSIVIYSLAYLIILTLFAVSLFEIYCTVRNGWRHPPEQSLWGLGVTMAPVLACMFYIIHFWMCEFMQPVLLLMLSVTVILYFIVLNVLYCVHLSRREKHYVSILQKKGKNNPWDKKALFHKLNDSLEFYKIVNWLDGKEKMNHRLNICLKKQSPKSIWSAFIVPSIIIPTIAAIIFLMILHGKESGLFPVCLLYVCLFIVGSKTICILFTVFCVIRQKYLQYKLHNGVSVDTDSLVKIQRKLKYKPFFLIPWEILPWLVGITLIFIFLKDSSESILRWKDILFWQGVIMGVPYMLFGISAFFGDCGWDIYFDKEQEKK